MTTVRTACRILATGGVILTASCQSDSTTTGPSTAPAMPNLRQEPGAFADPLLTHARAIPGFGGFFVDQDGTPTVYLKDPRQLGAAERALASTLTRLGATSSRLRVKRADYDYLQLNDWHTRTIPAALTVPGAVFADLDEGSNRLRFGVETPAAESGVRAALARLGIPGAAVVFERADPIYPTARLRGKVTPRRGGLLITFARNDSTLECTLGFNTLVSSGIIGFRLFVTASHCSRVRSAVDSTVYRQPVEQIGTEVADPPFFTGFPCPPGRRCRFSDAARVRYLTGPGSDLGGIARPVARAQVDGTRNIDSANPFFNITAELDPVQGVEVNKVGQRTGWTYAKIASTCAAANVAESNITLFCQSRTKKTGFVPGVSRPGDSGSPVFYWNGGSNVTLTGLLWGGNKSLTSFVFSPMSRIEQELGALRTF